MFRLGSLAGRVGASMAGNALQNVFQNPGGRRRRQSKTLAANAARVAETLGNLKGIPMKIGQMISLHERFLPPEVTEILSTLQQEAPSVPFSSILEVVRNDLGPRFHLIQNIEPESFAAASIGQVHRGVLKDGRRVVFKVQYPGIDRVIRADLKNLKGVLIMIFSMFTRMDLEPIWKELSDHLLEELDYRQEAGYMKAMSELWAGDPAVILPEVIEEASSPHVLCMTLVEGISPKNACADRYDPSLRDRWGQQLFRCLLAGLLRDRLLHADPNLANFAFRKDGRIIMYDFGCMKKVPKTLSEGYARLIRAVLQKNYEKIPGLLAQIGVEKLDKSPLPLEMVIDYAEVLQAPFQRGRTYTFGESESMYHRLVQLGGTHWHESMDIRFPKDVVFIDRTIGGHFGNLGKLRAAACWRDILEEFVPVPS
jgi:predicted unusual protein kinase regulating ubiquinone biosynthesis (AarF/ABC1/UbiB family)